MMEWSQMNAWVQKITDRFFRTICLKHNIIIEDDEMRIVLSLIKNNPYPLFNNEYAPILLLEIREKTNGDVYEKLSPLVYNHYLLEAMNEN